MTGIGDVLLALAMIALVALCAYGGYSFRDGQVADLKLDAKDQRFRADYQTEVLADVEARLQSQKADHVARQAAAQQQLAARGDRIAKLLADASARQATTAQMAAADEDCAPLRDLPVCAAVADRLFGGPVAAGAH